MISICTKGTFLTELLSSLPSVDLCNHARVQTLLGSPLLAELLLLLQLFSGNRIPSLFQGPIRMGFQLPTNCQDCLCLAMKSLTARVLARFKADERVWALRC
jgi:hypothetical protein